MCSTYQDTRYVSPKKPNTANDTEVNINTDK